MISKTSKNFDVPIVPDVENYRTIVEPEGKGKGYWAGAPSVIIGKEGEFWMAYRLRTPEERGHEVVIARSDDGLSFERVASITADDLEVQSLERPSLIKDPVTGKFKLYLSVDRPYYGWQIVKLEDVGNPAEFNYSTSKIALSPTARSSDARGVKDPFIFTIGSRYYMTYIGWDEVGEQAHLACSPDGENWEKSRHNPVLKRNTWHDGLTRIACVLPRNHSFDIYYEGSPANEFFNVRTGLAQSLDLETFYDLSPGGPVLSSPAKGELSTLRYLDYVLTGENILFYYSAARADGSFALRLTESNYSGQ